MVKGGGSVAQGHKCEAEAQRAEGNGAGGLGGCLRPPEAQSLDTASDEVTRSFWTTQINWNHQMKNLAPDLRQKQPYSHDLAINQMVN